VTRVCALALVAVAAAGCGSTKTVTRTATVREKGVKQFGYVTSLTRHAGSYVLRFDPAQFLSGEAANVAAAQDGAVEPGEPVPNDNYVVNETKRSYTYVLPTNARVTVLKDGVQGSPITVAQLAELVVGKNPFDKPLFEPITTGFWMRYDVDTVRSLEQQYHP
jgi:hypothetical protein